MTTQLLTDLTVADICDGFVYNELEGKGLFGWGGKLVIQPEVFEFIVDKAVEYKLGARGLRSIVETIMMDVMFEMPSMKVTEYELTLDYARQQMEKANISRLQNA